MVSVNALVNQAKYDAALEIWRDTVVNRLRKINFGQFGWHDNLRYSNSINFAKMLVENISPATYYAGSVSYYDYFDLTNSPYKTPKNVNWLASVLSGMKDSDDGIANFTMFITLPATYYNVSDTIYLKKFMQISSDFALRHKNLIKALPAAVLNFTIFYKINVTINSF